jgi:hypothetical protein
MGAQGLCKPLVGVRSPVGPPEFWVFNSVNRVLGYEPRSRGFESLKTLQVMQVSPRWDASLPSCAEWSSILPTCSIFRIVTAKPIAKLMVV